MLLDAYGRALEAAGTEERLDRWQNNLTGIGTRVDKSAHGRFFPVWRVLDQELTSLHSGSDLAAKVVDKRPDEMFRRGYDLEAEGVKASEVTAMREYAEEYLDLDNNMREGMRWGRLYGGLLAVLGVDDGQEPWMPLDEKRIKSFDYISLVDRRYAYVQSQYASIRQGKSKYGKPEIYLVSNAIAGYSWTGEDRIKKKTVQELRREGASISLIHESRVLRFEGTPADIVTRQQLAGWSWSVLQRVYDAMRQFEHAFDSVGYLLSDASQGVFKLQGLFKAITAGQRQDMADRAMLMEQTRSVMRGILLDAGNPNDGKGAESFERTPTPFGGIPDLLDKMMLRLAAAADMPATELFGRAPSGLNATGESDTRKWYDTIASEQEKTLSPKIRRVYRLLSLAKQGPLKGKDVRWTVKHKPLWSPTDKEVADVEFSNAQRDQIYIVNQVVKPEEVAVGLGDVYDGLDTEAREEVLEADKSFDPYPNDDDEDDTPGEEPNSPAVPQPVIGRPNAGPLQPNTPASTGPDDVGPNGKKTGGGGGAGGAPSGGGPGPGPGNPVGGASNAAPKGGAPKGPPPKVKKKAVGAPTTKAKPAPGLGGPAIHIHVGKTDAGTPGPLLTPHKSEASIVIVLDPQGRVLTVSRPEPGHEMALPGGLIEGRETPEEAAARELAEETGIKASGLEEQMVVESPEDGRRVHVFTAEGYSGDAAALEPDTRVAWMTPTELLAQAQMFRACVARLMNRDLLTAKPKADHEDAEATRARSGKFGPGGVTRLPAGSNPHVVSIGARVVSEHLTRKSADESARNMRDAGVADVAIHPAEGFEANHGAPPRVGSMLTLPSGPVGTNDDGPALDPNKPPPESPGAAPEAGPLEPEPPPPHE